MQRMSSGTFDKQNNNHNSNSQSKSIDQSASHPGGIYGAEPRQSFKGYFQDDSSEFNNISGIKRKGSNPSNEFIERFQGRQSLMNKEGHLGIVKRTNQPIEKIKKIELNQNLLKSSQK